MLEAIHPRIAELRKCGQELLDVLGFSEAVAVDGVVGDLNPVAGVMIIPPPTSLSAAIAGLKALVPSITEYLLEVMEDARMLHATYTLAVSLELVATVLFYTLEDTKLTGCNFYSKLNVALRSRLRENAKPYFGYLRMLLEALRQLDPHEGTVYRGIAGFDLTAKFPIGQRVRVWEVQSVSKLKKEAEKFASRGNKPQQTILVIKTQGVPVLGYLSLYPGEEECLFAPGSAFVASKVEQDPAVPGRVVIHLTHQAEALEQIYQ